jgi:hypothetical protein
MSHGRSPLDETTERFATCAAYVSPGGPRCGEPTTRLLVMTCAAEHGKLASTCDVHAAVAQELTEPGAVSVCGLCEDLTGTAEPMTIVSVEPWAPPPRSPG